MVRFRNMYRFLLLSGPYIRCLCVVKVPGKRCRWWRPHHVGHLRNWGTKKQKHPHHRRFSQIQIHLWWEWKIWWVICVLSTPSPPASGSVAEFSGGFFYTCRVSASLSDSASSSLQPWLLHWSDHRSGVWCAFGPDIFLCRAGWTDFWWGLHGSRGQQHRGRKYQLSEGVGQSFSPTRCSHYRQNNKSVFWMLKQKILHLVFCLN